MLAHRSGPLLVLGGPGTGKTSLMVELVASRIREGLDPARVLLLAPSRRAGADLRDRVASAVGRTIREPLARTAHSYAFGLIRREAVERGDVTPRLLAAAEQELVIGELLAHSTAPWPVDLAPALRTRHVAGQLRDLMLRAIERDVDPDHLVRLGERHDRQLWRAAGAFASEYAQVTALAHPSAYDPAELVRTAVDLLRDTPELLTAERRDRALVVVDDIAEADPALLDLLVVLAGGGSTLVATADPDSTVYGFRGADPQAVRLFPSRFRTVDGRESPQTVLSTTYRLASSLLPTVAQVSSRLGGSGRWRHMHAPGDESTQGTSEAAGRVLEAAVLASTSDEMAHVAARLRRRHLRDGVAFSRMAVVVRSAGDLSVTRRLLSRHGVPVVQRTDEVSLWQQPPVRALLDLLALVADADSATPERVVDLLLGPLGRLDPARLVVLRRSLLVAERRAGGARRPDEVLRDVVMGAGSMPADESDRAVDALAQVIAHGTQVAVDGSVEQVLWGIWDAAGVAQQWRSAALSGHRDGASADRDLDAVVALFEAAARFTDRLPGAGASAFLDHVRAQQVPGDSWATVSPVADAVTVLTAHATKGREWDTVAVCRVQEDLWPDLRRRQSLLGVEELVSVVDSGRLPSPAEQASTLLAAERRLFHLAITRASGSLLVTAVDDGEMRPSRLLDELEPQHGDDHVVRAAAEAVSLPAMVAELRAVVCDESSTDRERVEAARLLAVLAANDVPGADPDDWYGLAEATDDAPIFGPDEPVRLSPSQIEGYLRCPLRWMLLRAGGESGTALRQSIGTLVHDLAFEAARHDWGPEQIWAHYEQAWAGIDAGRGWVARRERTRVDAMVTRLVRWLEENPRTCVGVELEVSTQIADATVRGRLDRVDREGENGLLVVDFKTGTSAPTKAEVAENPQLGVYQWAVAAGAVGEDGIGTSESLKPVGGVLVHLGIPSTHAAKEQRQPALSEAADPNWPRELVEQVADGVARPVFAALVGPGCGHCPVRSSCPAQPDGGRVRP